MSNASAKETNDFTLRQPRPEDAQRLGEICYEAFKTISEEHGFPPDFPSVEPAVGLMSMMISVPFAYGVVAEDAEGRVVGSNFLWEMDTVAGVGPITIDPAAQNSSIGKALMNDVIRRGEEKGAPSIRLVQAAYHNRSLSLYTKLGFNTVEPLSLMNGPKIGAEIEGYHVRPMTAEDLDGVEEVCRRVHGISRRNEAAGAIQQGNAKVVEHDGRITGYTTVLGFFGHTVGESNEDLKALIAEAESIAGNGFLLPTRNSELMRWCFDHGLRIVMPLNLMSRGVYQEPRGAFMPSILF
ncbi:MAG: GNAT family N-acetyltransferase [Chloracidobacterium sp.]|nr:GNAT family N-acetyltransferase [Chloracidobacterium sp.]